MNRSRARSVYQALEQALEANSGKAALFVAGVLTLTAAGRERSHPRDGLVMALRVGAVALAGKALLARFRTPVIAGDRPMTLSSQAAGAATASQAAVEAAVDDALDMTFPASDPPAWGCLARRRSEADTAWAREWRSTSLRAGIGDARGSIVDLERRFDAVPFFWTEQYDFALAHVGHAESWDTAELQGRLDAATRDCMVTYRRKGQKLAVAVMHRDLDGLRAEVELEKSIRLRA